MAQESWKMDKDETGCQPPEGLVFCANNCGFFGSATTMNLCSKCYRDLVLKQTRASKIAADVQMKDAAEALLKEVKLKKGEEIDHASSEDPRSLEPSDDGSASSTPILPQEPSHQPPNRCFTCNKRIGLTGFKCKCGNLFCSLHRYTDKHNCSYDYKKAAQDAIAKANPIVKAHKLDKI